MTLTLTVANVINVYGRASDDQLDYGLNFYPRANDEAHRLCPHNPTLGAAVLAVISQQRSWNLNVKYARMIFAGQYDDHFTGFGGLKITLSKAVKMIKGEMIMDHVKGPKIIPFFETILNPNDLDAVPVIDRHAFDIAAGRVTDDPTRASVLGRAGGPEMVQALYRRAAEIISAREGKIITATMVQAITWTVWRDESKYGSSAARDPLAA